MTLPQFAPDSHLVADVVVAANREPRHNAQSPNLLLLHYTGMRSARAAIDWLARAESKVSCHYVVDTDGRITQLVPELLRAWHAGVSFWAGETDINSCSIGIEIQNPGHEMGYHPFPEPQMAAVAALGRDVISRHNIAPQRVLAHSDVAPRRKIDPGEGFDWADLARRGVGLWVSPSLPHEGDAGLAEGAPTASVRAAQRAFSAFGYDIAPSGALDAQTIAVVAAFQRHFRPQRVDGRIDLATLATLERLLAAVPQPSPM